MHIHRENHHSLYSSYVPVLSREIDSDLLEAELQSRVGGHIVTVISVRGDPGISQSQTSILPLSLSDPHDNGKKVIFVVGTKVCAAVQADIWTSLSL